MKSNGILLLVVLLLCFSCSDDVSGTASQAGNGFVSGIATDTNGIALANATVWLRTSSFLADTSGDSTELYETYSDDTGYFSFDSIPVGEFTIEIRQSDSLLTMERFKISENGLDTSLGKIQMSKSGSYLGTVDPSTNPGDTTPMHVRVFGLNVHTRVNFLGDFFFPHLPAGEQILHIVSGNPAIGLIAIDTVNIIAGTAHEGDSFQVPGSYSRDSLVVLDLFDHNGITPPSDLSTITTLGDDGRITGLTLDGIGIESVPLSFAHLPLRTLKMKNNSLLSTFPPGLDKMSDLDSLDLSGNNLTGLPPIVEDIRTLSYLNIDNNRLPTSFPALSQVVLDWIDNNSYNPEWRDTQRQ